MIIWQFINLHILQSSNELSFKSRTKDKMRSGTVFSIVTMTDSLVC
jgi:hypothetical protein